MSRKSRVKKALKAKDRQNTTDANITVDECAGKRSTEEIAAVVGELPIEDGLFSDQDNDENADVADAKTEHLDQVVSQIGPKSRSVIYIGHIPYGFFEHQLHAYFSQFGNIVKLRLSRNPKTLKSRHYAFIEFDNAQVAEIAAKAMNGYMMFGRTLACHVVDDENLHKDVLKRYWKASHSYDNRRPQNEEVRDVKRDGKSHEDRVKKIIGKQKRKLMKLKKVGIDFQPFLLTTAPKTA